MHHTLETHLGTRPAPGQRLLIALAMLFSFLVVGCGSSNEDYVYTGNNPGGNPPVASGAVTFGFARAQQTATVPSATQNLRFDFYNAQGATVGSSTTLPFQGQITIEDVPVTATGAVVTALDASGNALGSVRFTFTIVADQTVLAVPVSTPPTPVAPTLASFTLAPASAGLNVGQTVQLTTLARLSDGTEAVGGARFFGSSDASIASVSSSGLVTALANGTTTINASYSYGNITRTALATIVVGSGTVDPPDAGTLSVVPGSLLLNVSAAQSVTVLYAAPGQSSSRDVSAVASGVSSNTTVATYLNGVVTAGSVEGNATITLSYQGQGLSSNATSTLLVQVVRPENVVTDRLVLSADRLDVSNELTLEGNTSRTTGAFTATLDGRDVTGDVGVTFGDFSSTDVTSANFYGGYGRYNGGSELGFLIYGVNPFLGNPAPAGTTAVATVSYIEAGVTYTANIDLTVNNTPELEEYEILGIGDGSVVIPATDIYTLELTVLERYSNGSFARVTGNLTAAGFVFASSNENAATVRSDASSTVIAPADIFDPGNTTATITVTRDGEPVGTFTVTVVEEEVSSLAVIPQTLQLDYNQRGYYTVVATLTGGESQDITYARRGEDAYDVNLSSSNLSENLVGVVTVLRGNGGSVNFSIPGVGSTPATASLLVTATGRGIPLPDEDT